MAMNFVARVIVIALVFIASSVWQTARLTTAWLITSLTFSGIVIVCTVSWKWVYHSEGKNVKVVGTIRCCSFFELLIVTFRQHFLVPPQPRVISVLRAIMLPLQEELWRVFSPKQ